MATREALPFTSELLASFLVPNDRKRKRKRDHGFGTEAGESPTTSRETERNSDSPINRSASGQMSDDSRDRDKYFSRVETYRILTWFGKPDELSPLVCARYGWKNTDCDILECVLCKNIICGQLPKTADRNTYTECVNKVKEKLTSAHEKACKWASNPSPESFNFMPLLDKSESVSDFNQRLKSLLPLGKQLPLVSTKTLKEQGLEEDMLTRFTDKIKSQFSEFSENSAEVFQQAVLLTLCGWELKNNVDKEDVLTCYCCRRNVKLSYYVRLCSSDVVQTNVASTDSVMHEPGSVNHRTETDNGNSEIIVEKDSGTIATSPISTVNSNTEEIQNNKCERKSSSETDSQLNGKDSARTSISANNSCGNDGDVQNKENDLGETENHMNKSSVDQSESSNEDNSTTCNSECGSGTSGQVESHDDAGPNDKIGSTNGCDEKAGNAGNKNGEHVNRNSDSVERQAGIENSTKKSLDPLQEHRNWCPWINSQDCSSCRYTIRSSGGRGISPSKSTHSPTSNFSKQIQKRRSGAGTDTSISDTSQDYSVTYDTVPYPWKRLMLLLHPSLVEPNVMNVSFSDQNKMMSPREKIRKLHMMIQELQD